MSAKETAQAEPAHGNGEVRPRLIVGMGRGRTGKTTLLTAIVQEERHAGRTIRAWDTDPAERSLSRRVKDAEQPDSIDEDGRRVWLETRLDEMVQAANNGHPFDAVLDVGADDILIAKLGAEMGLIEIMESQGVSVIALHLAGATPSDLRYMAFTEKTGAFKPHRAVLVENLHLASRPEDFAPIEASDVVKAFKARERGGVVMQLPKLPPDLIKVCEENPGTTLRELSDDATRLAMFNRIRLKNWLTNGIGPIRAAIA